MQDNTTNTTLIDKSYYDKLETIYSAEETNIIINT